MGFSLCGFDMVVKVGVVVVNVCKDGNGAVWVRFRPTPTRLETRPKKTVYCLASSASTGSHLTRPNLIQFFFFGTQEHKRKSLGLS